MPDLQQFLRNLNQAWVEERYDDLLDYFDERVVMLMPESDEVAVGAGPLVESYRQFGSAAVVHAFEIKEITLFEHEAVVMGHLKFTIDYELPHGRFQESGLDVYAIATTGPQPKVIWRTQVRLEREDA